MADLIESELVKSTVMALTRESAPASGVIEENFIMADVLKGWKGDQT